MKIKLYNRDGASLWLVKTEVQIEPNIYKWKLEVDDNHKYIFEYCRIIYANNSFKDINAIDPSGGPYLALADEFENKYKIVKINNINDIWISERNNDN